MSELLDDPQNPVTMSPHQRKSEIATILARGVLRLRQMVHFSPGSSTTCTAEKSSESRKNGLDVQAKARPHVINE